MAIPPIRSHGDSGHLQDHNNIKSTLDTHDGYLNQGVRTTDIPTFGGIKFGQVQYTSAIVNISNNLSTTIDSFSASAYRSAEYHVQLSQGSKYATAKVTVLHDNTNAGVSEYGKVEMGGNIPYVLSADISGPNVLFSCIISDGDVTPSTIKFFRTIINL
jgi:hypothetical protein